MHALRLHAYGTPPDLRWEQVPDPVPGAGQVVVDVKAAGVNPVDVYVVAGTYADFPLPFTPGMDAAGEVSAAGTGVDDFAEGDRVVVTASTAGRLRGAFAEKVLCDVTSDAAEGCPQVWKLPDGLTFAQGAAINVPYVTAFRALFDAAKVQAGESVLVHGGTGGVGVACVQIARAHGLRVWATGGSKAGLDMLRGFDLPDDRLLDHSRPGYLDRLPPEGVDVIIEMLANVNLPADLTRIARRGRIVVVGNRGTVEINPRLLMGSEALVTGVNYWGGGPAGVFRAMQALSDGMAAGDIRPVVQAEFPMSEAQKAFDLVTAGGSRGKVVLVP